MYATEQDIIDRHGAAALTIAADRDNDGVADPGVVDKALADATVLMDSYIQKKYDLPLPAPTPEILAPVCVDVAWYKLSSTPGMMTEEIERRHKDAIRWLENLAKGLVSLGVDQSPPSAGGGVQVESKERVFTRDTLKGI